MKGIQMDKKSMDRAKRERAAKLRLGSENPRCATCGNSDWECLEAHHLGQHAFDEATVIICRNDHRILSDRQKDHPAQINTPPSSDESLAHFLMGMADLFELLVRKLREFADKIINRVPASIEVSK